MNTPLRDEIIGILLPQMSVLKADQNTDAILNLIASKMPEKKDIPEEVPLDGTYGGNWDDIWENGQDVGNAQGHNEAIDSVKSILKGGTDDKTIS